MPDAVIGALRVVLGADSAAFEKQLDRVSGRVEQFGAKLGKAIGSFYVFDKIKEFGVESFKAFEDSEKAIAKMEAALKSTSGAVGFTSSKLQDMAEQLQKISTYDHADILGNVTANLLRFTSLTGSTFKDAQLAVLNVAAAMKKDLAESATLVGKALASPEKAIGALRKAGIVFTEAQKKVIESLVKTGQTARAQQEILKAFTEDFGGQAAALAGTADGKWTQAMNAITDAMEKVGAMLAPFVVKFAEEIKSIAEAFTALDPSTQKFIVIMGVAAAAIAPIIFAFGLISTAVASIGAPLAIAVIAIGAFIAIAVGSSGAFDDLGVKGPGALGKINASLEESKKSFQEWKNSWANFAPFKMITEDLAKFSAGNYLEKTYLEFQILFTRIRIGVIDAQKYFSVLGLEFERLGVKIQLWILPIKLYFETVWLGAQIMAVKAGIAILEFGEWLVSSGKAIKDWAVNLAGVAWDGVTTKFTEFSNWIATKGGEVKAALLNAGAAFVNLKNVAVDAAWGIYSAAKKYLQDALGSVIDSVMAKIHALEQTFKDLYDAVIGHSYIPDLVKGAEHWFGRLQTSLPNLAKKAADGVGDVFSKMNTPGLTTGDLAVSKTVIGQMNVDGSKQAAQPVNNFYSTVSVNLESLPLTPVNKQQLQNDFADMFRAATLRPA